MVEKPPIKTTTETTTDGGFSTNLVEKPPFCGKTTISGGKTTISGGKTKSQIHH